MPIICDTDIATRLGLSPSDNSLVGIADSVNASIVGFLWFDPSANATKTEYFDTNGGSLLALNHGPVASITSVNELGSAWWGWWTTNGGAYAEGTDPFDSTNLLTYGTDYAWNIDAGSRGPVLVRLNSLWPISWTRAPNRLAGNLSPSWGCVRCIYQVDDSGVLAIAKNAAMMEALYRQKMGFFGFGFANSAGMDGASVSITPYVRQGKAVRGGLLNPTAVELLSPYYRRAL